MSYILFVSILSLIITAIGFIGVQKTGNYENNFGYMLIYGAVAFIISMIVIVVKVTFFS